MRVLIVDDEPAARRRLASMLDELAVEVVGEAADGVAALDLIRQRRLDGATRPAVTADVLARVESALGAFPHRTRVLVRHGAGHRAVPLRDITQFVADEGLVTAVTSSARCLTDYTLNELEARLPGAFVRTSRAALVNVDRVDRIVSNGDGSATLTLAGGATVHVSRRKAADVRRVLESS